MRIGQKAIERRVEALALLSQGYTQVEAARLVGVSDRTVRKWRALQKLNCAVPRGPLADALKVAYQEEQHSRARAKIFVALVDMAQEDARLLRVKIKRGVLHGAEEPGEDDAAPEPSQRSRSFVYGDAEPAQVREIGARALELLRSFDASE